MPHVTVHQAKTNLSKLLAEVEAGEEVVVCKGKQPVAKLVPFREKSRKRPAVGVRTSKPVHYTEDCFSPLSSKELEEWGIL
jgi:prevent-host-death family protein